MATINRKLIHFNSEGSFNTAKTNNQLKDTSIVLVGDHANAIGKKIYSHGETYITHYEGSNGIKIVDDLISNYSDNILFLATTGEYNTLIANIGGEDKLQSPCVIYIADSGQIIYAIADEETDTEALEETE